MSADTAKRAAMVRALDFVEAGMVLGLGTGSTVEAGLPTLAERIAAGLRVTCVPSSQRTAEAAARLGLPLVALNSIDHVDLSIDGADQVDRDLNMIKGHGGAHLREKVLASIAQKRVFVIDGSKLVERLGQTWLPLELLPYGASFALKRAAAVTGGEARFRPGERSPRRSDNGNLLAECRLGEVADPALLDRQLHAIPGILETGLFIGMVDILVTGDGESASVRYPAPKNGVLRG